VFFSKVIYIYSMAKEGYIFRPEFPNGFPCKSSARSCIQVQGLPYGAKIEIEAIAYKDRRERV
jgi:enamine deaminase RidA (YjgF/YER057c/UK114 family)